MPSSRHPWNEFTLHLRPLLGDEDDPHFWEAALDVVFADAEWLCRDVSGIRANVGRCSHWLLPHQSRWTADGGFAWPSGYGGRRVQPKRRPGPRAVTLHGLPEFNWFVPFVWEAENGRWRPSDRPSEAAEFRVVLPARTARHRQAVVHAVWNADSFPSAQEEVEQIYGFRQRVGAWQCTAYSCSEESIYEALDNECGQYERHG